MKLAGEALDQGRKSLRRATAGGLWALRSNVWTRSAEQQALREQLCKSYPKLARAMVLRDSLQDVLASTEVDALQGWLGWAVRCFSLRTARAGS